MVAGDGGIFSDSQHGQERHEITAEMIKAEHKMCLTIEAWQVKQVVTSWDIPKEFLVQ